MTLLLIGIAIFLGIHLFRYFPARDELLRSLGDGPYRGLFSVVSAAGLGLMIWGLWSVRDAPEAAAMLYEPAPWTRHAAMLLVLLGFISLAVSFHKGRLRLWLRNPMSIGIALWAFGHLLANGEVASVYFFGAFLLLALVDIAVNTARGRIPQIVPKPSHDAIAIVAGLILYAVFLLGFHPYVLNLPIV